MREEGEDKLNHGLLWLGAGCWDLNVIWVINNSTLLYYELSKLMVKTYSSHGLYCVRRYMD